MKHLTPFLFALCCVILPATMHAQKDNDSKYLTGAVPEVNGRVVFSKEFEIPGMSQDEIYQRLLDWMQARLKKNENTSRVVYTNAENGQIVGTGDEWIVFKSSALSLDRTKIQYQLSVTCQPQKCVLEISKIHFVYREGKEKYTAEEWITDKYALNKKKNKLVWGLAKWRRKTVDFADSLCMEAADALSSNPEQKSEAQKEEKKEEEKSMANSGPMVITPKKEKEETPIQQNGSKVTIRMTAPSAAASTLVTGVTATKNAVSQTSQEEVKGTDITTKSNAAQKGNLSSTNTANAPAGYHEVVPEQLPTSAIQMGTGKLVIVIGTDAFNMTMMTANAGGSLGKMSGKTVIYTLLAPDQPYEQMEKADNYVVRFYPTGKSDPSVILECTKLPSQAPLEGQPRMYAGKIVKAYTK